MNITKQNELVWFNIHEVTVSPAELLIIEVALNELRERLDRGTANSEVLKSTIDLWMSNRAKGAGIHESSINRLERDVKDIITKLGIKS